MSIGRGLGFVAITAANLDLDAAVIASTPLDTRDTSRNGADTGLRSG